MKKRSKRVYRVKNLKVGMSAVCEECPTCKQFNWFPANVKKGDIGDCSNCKKLFTISLK